MRLTAVLLLFVGIEGLKVGGAPSGIGRRAALIGASTSLTGLAGVVSLPRAAHADAIADIAARSNAIAQQEAVAKAKKEKEGDFLGDAASNAFNLALTGATVGLLGAVGFFLFSAKTDADKSEGIKFTKDVAGNSPEGYKSTFED